VKDEILSLVEVEVHQYVPVLLSGTASQSSGFSDLGGGLAIRAIDGNYDQVPGGFSVTHTALLGDTDPWYEVPFQPSCKL
jgi:hypothetical protein